jgi:hypothetical protein
MALSTPFNLTQRGLTANAGVTTSKYPHSQVASSAALKTITARFSGPDATTVKGAALATSDVFQLVNVPAGAFVLGVAFKVVTAEGGTCTFDIGDGSQTAGYFSGANGNTTTNAFSWDESPASIATVYGVGHFYATADTIDLLLASGTAATVVADITVTYIDTAPVTH